MFFDEGCLVISQLKIFTNNFVEETSLKAIKYYLFPILRNSRDHYSLEEIVFSKKISTREVLSERSRSRFLLYFQSSGSSLDINDRSPVVNFRQGLWLY